MPWEKASTAGELSSTASIFGGAGDGLNEMLRKKFYERREFFYVRRDIFYVASLWGLSLCLAGGGGAPGGERATKGARGRL